MPNRRIIYISTVRYPTEKAYGVTIKYTMKALDDLGFQTLVIDPNMLVTMQNAKIRNRILLSLLKKRELKTSLSRIIFNLRRLLIATSVNSTIDLDNTVLWTRDPIVALTQNIMQKPHHCVIEIHQTPHFLDKCLLKILNQFDNVTLAPISQYLVDILKKSKLQFNFNSILQCSMGVSNEFLNVRSNVKPIVANSVSIAYVGSLKSNNIDQGLFNIMKYIIAINKSLNRNIFQLRLYGISIIEENEICNAFKNAYDEKIIVCERRQSQTDLIPKLLNCDIFLLPYPEGEFFNARFPLKAMEYAALKRPILITNTPSHRNIFHDDEVWFFEFSSYTNFQEVLFRIIKDKEIASEKIIKAFSKAKKYTYVNRVEKIVKKFMTSTV